MGTLVPLQSKLFSSPSRIHWKTEAPQLAILLTVARQWDLPTEIWKPSFGEPMSRLDRLEPAEKFRARGI